MNNRLTYVDLAKGVGIFFMVLCHGVVTHEVDTLVHGFHMPLFFVISGWCFSIKRHPDFGKFIGKRAKSLLIPYFFWGIALYLGWSLWYWLTDKSRVVAPGELLNSLLYNNAMVSPYCGVQWFLTCMFLVGILGWLALTLTKENPLSTLAVAFAFGVVGWLVGFLPVRLPLSLDVAFSATCLFLMGNLLGRIRESKKLFHPLLTPTYALVGGWLIFENGYVNMRTLSFGNPFVFYVGAVATTLGILGICFWVSQWVSLKPMVWLGKNTLAVLVLNQVFMQPLKQHIATKNPWIWLGLSVGALLCMTPCIWFLNRFLPFSVGKSHKKL